MTNNTILHEIFFCAIIAPLFQRLGAPVPFFLGGLILAVLWIVSPRAIKKNVS
jgi:hypothetical protein